MAVRSDWAPLATILSKALLHVAAPVLLVLLVLLGALVQAEAEAERKGLATRLGPADGLPPMLVGDGTRLRQMRVNLLANAVKDTVSGQVLLQVRLAASRSAGHCQLRFAVIDTGPGIDESHQQRLFEPFERAAEPCGVAAQDVGLSLSIVKQLVTLMGGRLALDSAPGQGSGFRFELDLGLQLGPDPHQAEDPAALAMLGRQAAPGPQLT